MKRWTPIAAAFLLTIPILSSCDDGASAELICEIAIPSMALPPELRESSGAALSRTTPDIFWSHNDSGHDSVVYALSANTGELLGSVRVTGATNRDWEDIAIAPCDSGDCIYIADTGDNYATRDSAIIYRIPEPDPVDGESAPAEVFPVRYPDGARDVEALFVLPDGRIYLVTKGGDGPITLYHYPPPLREGELVTLERVRELATTPELRGQMVTAAAATPDGEMVLIRTYRSLLFYDTDAILTGSEDPTAIDLSGLGMPQSEAVDIDRNGAVILTSEGEGRQGQGVAAALRCTGGWVR